MGCFTFQVRTHHPGLPPTWGGGLLTIAILAGVAIPATTGCSRPVSDTGRAETERATAALHAYVMMQEAYLADHGHYSAAVDSLRLPDSFRAGLIIAATSAVSHSAFIRTGGSDSEMLCVVWVGERPAQLDQDRPAEPACDRAARFDPWLAALGRSSPGVSEPQRPIRSGVLLGLDSPEDGLRTLWIAGDRDSAAVVARGPGLLVPRARGFWRVERPVDCPYVAAGPAEGWPKGAWTDGPYGRDTVPTRCPRGRAENETGVSTGDVDLLFVGRDYLNIHNVGEASSGSAVDSRDDRYVALLDSIGESRLSIEQVLPPPTLKQLEVEAQRMADSLKRERAALDPATPDAVDDACVWGLDPDRLSAYHWRGVWTLRGYLAPAHFACDRFPIADLVVAPPELVGHNELFPVWEVIHASVPTALDAVSSPRRDLVIVLTKDSLYGYHVAGEALGRRAFAVAEAGAIVMAEWAAGPEIRVWPQQLKEFLGRSEPEDYSPIVYGKEWMTVEKFKEWATVVPSWDAVRTPCDMGFKNRLADSLSKVLRCERIAVVPERTGAYSAQLVWAIVRTSTASPRNCIVELAYLGADRMVTQALAGDCDFVMANVDPSELRMAFRTRATGEVGFVIDQYVEQCEGRHAIVARGDHFEHLHKFYHECPR